MKLNKGRVDGRNYVRHTIIALIRFQKLIAVDASYAGRAWLANDENLDRMVFTDIRPYVSNDYFTYYLCNHMTFDRDQVLKEYNISSFDLKRRFVLICQPYVYKDCAGNSRGGLKLARVDGLPTISEKFSAPDIDAYIKTGKIFDFRENFLNQPYAWEKSKGGQNDQRPKEKEKSFQEKYQEKRFGYLVSSRKAKTEKQKEKEIIRKEKKMTTMFLSPKQSVFHRNPKDIVGVRQDYLEFLKKEGNAIDDLLKKMHENDEEILRQCGKPEEDEEEFWIDSYDDESR